VTQQVARRVDGVLLDVDDTLVDTRAAFEQALGAVARTYLPQLPTDALDDVLAIWRADVVGHYRRYTRGEISYVEQRRARANELHERFGGPVLDEAGFARWDDVFETAFADAWRAHEDAPGAVAELVGTGLAVGALTNAATAYQTGKLHRAGLGHVPVLVGTDTLGVGKPAPEVFLEACRRLGTAPERTAYVGDELDIDAVAAAAVGLVGVWLDRPGPRRVDVGDDALAAAEAAGVRVVTTLTGLADVLALP
jgi:putative hydrolase of the HAD superfamily